MKATRIKFKKKGRLKAEGTLDLVHTDLCGPIGVKSMGGAEYILTFIDDYSRKSDIYLLKRKSEVFDYFKMYKNRVERETGQKIKILRSDNGTEFNNNVMSAFLTMEGIKHELTTIYSPQQNGTAERLNRTLLEKTRCLLKDANLPNLFWGEAVKTANYIRNHVMTSICKEKVPIELWSGRRPSIKFFRIFGCTAYATIPKQHRGGKLNKRAVKGIFIGYDENRKAYRVWDPSEKKVMHSRDVRFIEEEQGWQQENERDGTNYDEIAYAQITVDEVKQVATPIPVDRTNEDVDNCDFVLNEETEENEENELETSGSEHDTNEIRNLDESASEEEEETMNDHWSDGRNLRTRTANIRPTKYTMVTTNKVTRQAPSLEELTRQYGWRDEFDY
jgi:transposase InsO family protein